MLARMRSLRAGLTGLVLLALTACGGAAPDPVDESGIDGLRIPTPSPEPGDFQARVTNPWLAWRPGARWEYSTTDRDRPATYVVTVRRERVTVAGVEATAVDGRLVLDRTGRVVEEETTYAAQDRDGNVWQLGQDTGDADWRAGRAGARAGLLMPATPRVGDGFLTGEVGGEPVGRLTVLDLSAPVPEGADSGAGRMLQLERVPGEGGPEEQEYYRRGTGLVARTSAAGDLLLASRS